ncbi:MAG: dTMP kinase [Candidatus Anstonellaceae archaeon]
MLLAFEGIDGSGKGEQIRLLASYLRQKKIRYRIHKYPTKKAKQAFLHLRRKADIPSDQLADIFIHDIMGGQGKIKKELKAGFVVICDRYLHSTLAYQGVGMGYLRLKEKILGLSAQTPDLVFILDIDPAVGRSRKVVQKALDRHENDVKFLSLVRKNYMRMVQDGFLSYCFAVLDASKPKDEVFASVLAHLEPIITRMKS